MGIICMISLSYSICMYLIIGELWLGDKENWESTKVKKFKP